MTLFLDNICSKEPENSPRPVEEDVAGCELLAHVAGLTPLTDEKEAEFIRKLDAGEINLHMKVDARACATRGLFPSRKGDTQTATLLEFLISFANHGEAIMQHILYDMLPVDEPSIERIWHKHALKEKGPLRESADSNKEGETKGEVAFEEPPSAISWPLLCDDPRRDIAITDANGQTIMDRLVHSEPFKRLRNDSTAPLVTLRLKHLLSRHPHFSDHNTAYRFAIFSRLHEIQLDPDKQEPFTYYTAYHAGAAFCPKTIFDVEPYHLEALSKITVLKKIVESPIWKDHPGLLQDLLFSMHPNFQSQPRQTIIDGVAMHQRLANRDFPAQGWSAEVGR